MSSLSDFSLVTQVAVMRNKRAFGQLVEKYQSPVRRFFMSHTLGDVQLSDDLSQETFIKAYTNIASFRKMSSFSTWLFRIAYHVLYDYKRSHKVTTDVDCLVGNSSAVRHDEVLKMDIYNALGVLKPDELTCVTLQLMEGYPIEEISEITGMASGTVKSHLSRGKKRLALYLKENGYGK